MKKLLKTLSFFLLFFLVAQSAKAYQIPMHEMPNYSQQQRNDFGCKMIYVCQNISQNCQYIQVCE